MFYSQFILAKKGPLGTIWIAAHLERKLRKNQVADTDIGVSVDSILFPEVPIALRLSSHLLLGVVRIYSRKVNYLFDDCSEALLKIKQAFRSTAVDLPPEESTAPYHSITLPETFDLDDFELPDSDIFQGNFIDHHVSTREQITLQDTIDGAVYSTSQFGLDERFGDGDTSQIGLEIDEELYMDKVAASGNGVSDANAQASVQSHMLLQNGRSDEEMTETFDIIESHGNETVAASTETKDSAGGPLTAGLKELKVSSDQDALLSDDHVEADCCHSTDLGSRKTAKYLQGMSCLNQQERDREVGSLQNDLKHDTAVSMDIDSHDCYLSKMENENHRQEHSNNDMVAQEQGGMQADEHSSMTPCAMPDQENPLPLAPDSPNRIVDYVNVSEEIDNVGTNNESFVNAKGHIGVSNIQISYGEEGLHPQCERWRLAATCQLGSPGAPEVHVECPMDPKEIGASKSSQEVVPCNELHVLRSCSSNLSHPDISSGGKHYASDQMSEPLCQELQSDSRKLNEQFENEIFRCDHSEALSKSATPGLHEPEKMLSLPYGPCRSTDALPTESLPEFTALGDDSVARAKSVSGKKRSFTESTVTVQSFNSVESFGVSQQRTEIPDDDDLLSSILVGRRSSIIRIKSTPAALGTALSKRPQTTNRSCMSKRKVLMDDAMVLHGDMIRQQLTNTEDIRRIRRKAPCTCSEILTIQRQFLEDEIFGEPLFTGLSQKLIQLHSKTFDLRGTVVFESNPNNAFLETCDKRESNLSASGSERNLTGPDVEVQLLASDVEAQHTEIALLEESHQTKDELGPDNTPCHALEEFISDAKSIENSQHTEVKIAVVNVGISDDKLEADDTPCHALAEAISDSKSLETSEHADVHISGKDVEIHGTTDASVFHGLEATITCDPASADNCEIQDGGSTIVVINNNCQGCFKHISGFSTVTNADGSLTMKDELSDDNHAETRILATENEENDIGKEICTNGAVSDIRELVTTSKESLELNEPPSGNMQQPVNGSGSANISGMLEDEVPSFRNICSEETTLHPIEIDLDREDASLNDDENQVLHEADNLINADAFNRHLVDDFCDNSATMNDTGFLNVDDDVVDEEDGGIQCAEGAQNLENSGWSSRTRAVANYLQTLFDKESVVGRRSLCLDNLLTGKTRKEASRMFFETLVLKTKDYIHVEQICPYDVVHIKPQPKLMKLEF